MSARNTGDATRRRPPAQRKSGGSSVVPEFGSVEAAVRRDLARLEARDPDLAASALAASAVAMAQEIDEPGNSATSKSMCARAMLDAIERLFALAPAEEVSDALDELQKRRASKLGVSGTTA